ncbi:hypothetical protein [Streptomyces sp. NBC_01304]|uniref:hypothetical protein n=1 Tax=Streptomyces sp. NBC_01304 TaxID=2903818 RepID=UPI002E15CBF8|nr:hypothetical protein OG430_40485 [Streptomyces sp. NBC_01304]
MTEPQQPEPPQFARRPDPQEPMSMSEPRQPTPAAEPGTALPPGECDKLQLRLHHAVNGFVDAPRPAVEEADALLGELIAKVGQILGERHAMMRESWQDATGDSVTEDLRTALREYRSLAERLLRL